MSPPLIPESVLLGPHRYTIDTSPSAAAHLRAEESQSDAKPDYLMVQVDADRPHTRAAECLLHELLHCVFCLVGLNRLAEVNEQQEVVINSLTPGILELLRRNPHLVAYLTAGSPHDEGDGEC